MLCSTLQVFDSSIHLSVNCQGHDGQWEEKVGQCQTSDKVVDGGMQATGAHNCGYDHQVSKQGDARNQSRYQPPVAGNWRWRQKFLLRTILIFGRRVHVVRFCDDYTS